MMKDERASVSPSIDLSVLDGNGGSGGWNSSKPIGKGNPPRATSWKKGDSSPNPKGAPRKRNVGPFSKKLNQKIEGRAVTFREALDNKVLTLTLGGNVRASQIYHGRLERERQIDEQHVDCERYAQQQREASRRRPANLRFEGPASRIINGIARAKPGLLESLVQLEALKAIEFRDGQYVVADWLKQYL